MSKQQQYFPQYLSHSSIIKIMNIYLQKEGKSIKANLGMKGVCNGFAAKYIDACLVDEQSQFYDKLALLSEYKDEPEHFFLKLASIRNKVKSRAKLTTSETLMLEIPALFEGIAIQQSPDDYRSILKSSFFTTKPQDFLKGHLAAKPQLLEKEKVEKVYESHHMVKKADLINMLKELKSRLLSKSHKKRFVFRLANKRHTIALSFDCEKQCWELIDINRLHGEMILDQSPQVKRVFHQSYIHENQLANSIFKSLNFNHTNHIYLSLEGYDKINPETKASPIEPVETNPYYQYYCLYGLYIMQAVYAATYVSLLAFGVPVTIAMIVPLVVIFANLIYETQYNGHERIYDFFDRPKDVDDETLSYQASPV